uniref:RIIa domain-containing protein n=1 Tax=Pyramimonas obovata TaxID=1411642 RepID=A0A7S0WFF6_9CHLO|mmetsp:Transcript_24261/g.52934  ORF Transcript_24261/g.52934 Transcript_24261/m.52934 type:complete len:205 (+) Transcript_24261:119-733(+)|eukprot:CAMPEP_0118933146 /NCGR_PEP_ID=MMETSP1169-20130426/11426_1 /TAXON_ID=36882 /ORGANISM="Pyramimonas obovata, Strain CCMP722" /LENGTH=204 /DNA_ID=CAMNT_0006875877 /DNA_START=120 /DNA_END=734 /DNA_ORIENTATION=-
MDLEPIYCAEQIVVPPDLADILKAYTKEVVRRQPEDLLEFSAIYFANLANVSGGPADSVVPPSLAELRQVYGMVKEVGLVDLQEFVNLCSQAGVASSTLDAMFRLGDFTAEMVDPKDPLVLLLTMTDSTFLGVVSALFEVFGDEGKLGCGEFVTLFQFMASKDSSMDPSFIESVATSMQESGMEALTMDEFSALPMVQEFCGGM